MKKILYYFLLLAATAGIALHVHAQPKLTRDNVKKVVAAKTPGEKVHSVAGADTSFYPPLTTAKRDSSKSTLVKKVNKVLVHKQPLKETKPAAVNSTNAIEELNGFAIGM